MANTIMRNRVTGEYRKIEADSDEYWELRAELHADGRPRWEQTGQHDYAGFQQRVETNTLRPEDVGDDGQPVEKVVATGDLGFSAQLDRGWPTPGEIEQNAGRAADMSEEELIAFGGGGTQGEGYPAGHPPELDEDEAAEAGVTTTPVLNTSGTSVTDEQADQIKSAQGGDTESSESGGGTPSTARKRQASSSGSSSTQQAPQEKEKAS